jgi:hypothetical protein
MIPLIREFSDSQRVTALQQAVQFWSTVDTARSLEAGDDKIIVRTVSI